MSQRESSPHKTAQDLLDRLQQRVDVFHDNIATIENALHSSPQDAKHHIDQVNEQCDFMVNKIEQYRSSILGEIEQSLRRKMAELNDNLTSCNNLYHSSLKIHQKCSKYLSRESMRYNKRYHLVGLHSILRKGYRKESKLEKNRIPKSIGAALIPMDFTKLLASSPDPYQIEIGCYFQLKQDTKIMVHIPVDMQSQLVIEHWFRTSCGLLEPPQDPIALAIAYSLLHDQEETFNVDLSHPTFQFDDERCLSIDSAFHSATEFAFHSAFGSKVTCDDRQYRWRLQIEEMKGMSANVNIGVMNANQCEDYQQALWWLTDIGYSYFSGNGAFYHKDVATFGGSKSYGEEYGAGDVIEIILDLKEHSIAFGLNGNQYSWQSVQKGVSYRLAIGISVGCKMTIKLLSFSEKPVWTPSAGMQMLRGIDEISASVIDVYNAFRSSTSPPESMPSEMYYY